MAEHEQIRASGRAFILAAFRVLADQHVIPVSTFRRFLRVGHDYAGPNVMALAEFTALETDLEADYQARFNEPLERPENAEFANSYIFSFLESAIARCGSVGDYSPSSTGIDAAIADLLGVLDTPKHQMVCCRVVSHLTTAGDARFESEGITVVPEPPGFRALQRLILDEVPTAHAELEGIPLIWDRPRALIVARESANDVDPIRAGLRLSAQIDRLLLQLRLLSAGTMQSLYEIRGPATVVAGTRPQLVTFTEGVMPSLVSRVVELGEPEVVSATALGTLIEEASVKRDGLVVSSFDLAVRKFDESSTGRDALNTLVDLAVGLEASFADEDGGNDALTLRLCTRAAALLATADDTGSSIFADIAALYGLRSRMIHGGPLKQKRLYSVIQEISTIPEDDPPGVALARAVDRMRDLVRRSILARVSLAAGEQPVWPFRSPKTLKVDKELADDATRESWRQSWRAHLSFIGAGGAAERPRAPANFFTEAHARRASQQAAQRAVKELEGTEQ